ncbi:MAG: hypothetical protein WCK70_04455 [Chloroflexales bacterium]|jgi:hypothetical protein
MELLIIIVIAVLFGTVALSSAAQGTPQPPQVVYIRVEQLDALRSPHGEGGAAIILLCIVVVAAIYLL